MNITSTEGDDGGWGDRSNGIIVFALLCVS
jgi:hypothetical protein